MSRPPDGGVGLAIAGDVARITIDRPKLRNALDPAAWAALRAAVDGACAASVAVIVVTGANGVFCAGGDLSTIEARLAMPEDERRQQLADDAQAIVALLAAERPTVALIDGAAMGAGLALALACDVRVASARSRFSAAFRNVGVAGDFGISWLLPRQVGRGRALDLLYTGEVFDAGDAQRIGLVERVIADDAFEQESARYVQHLAQGPASLALIRASVDAAAETTLAEAIPLEAAAQAKASRTADAREGARAFLEKRAPVFTRR